MPKVNSINPAIQHLTALRNEQLMSSVTGNYKNFKQASKDFASLAVKNFEIVQKLPMPKVTVPLFSKMGMNMAKVWFLNLFRKKTPAEKEFKRLAQEDFIRRQYLHQIHV